MSRQAPWPIQEVSSTSKDRRASASSAAHTLAFSSNASAQGMKSSTVNRGGRFFELFGGVRDAKAITFITA
jgi:hypothetical protein